MASVRENSISVLRIILSGDISTDCPAGTAFMSYVNVFAKPGSKAIVSFTSLISSLPSLLTVRFLMKGMKFCCIAKLIFGIISQPSVRTAPM